MKLFMFVCYFSSIITSKNHSLKRINLIFDRAINKMLYLNGSIPIGLSLKEDEIENEKIRMFIWDKYFPRPLYYFFECDMFWNSNDQTQLQLKCLSTKGEKLFRFDVTEYSGEFENPIFYDIDDKKLNIESRFKSRLEYFISSHEEDIESVKNSITYTNLLDSVKSCYLILIERFDVFMKESRDFLDKYRKLVAEDDKELISKVGEVETLSIKITNTFVKSIAFLKFPFIDKLEYVKSYDDFQKNIDDANDLVETLLSVINRKLGSYSVNKGNMIYNLHNFKYKATNFREELKKDEPYSIKDRFKDFLKFLNDINEYINEIKSKNKPNTQISLDCDVKKVDSFVDKYSSILIEYCDILGQNDEILINRYYFDKTLKSGNLYHKPLEDFFADSIVSKEMKEYLLNYHVDKTDFLIFIQSDYFKKKLLARIIDNLQTLIFSYNLKNEPGTLTQNKKDKVSEDEQKYIKRIKDLHKKLKDIFKTNDSSGLLSFDKFIDNNISENNTTKLSRKSNDNEESSFFKSTAVILGGCILCLMIYFIICKRRTNN